MKYFTTTTLLVIYFASILELPTVAQAAKEVSSSSPIKGTESSKGYKLENRVRKVRKRSNNIEDDDNNIPSDHLRQWDEEEYEAIMGTMSGQHNLRQRMLQQQQQQHGSSNSEYQKKPYYSTSGGGQQQQHTTIIVTRTWQKAALGSCTLIFFALLFYVIALKKELASLNQYIPLGYKLFPDHGEEEEGERPTSGVELR